MSAAASWTVLELLRWTTGWFEKKALDTPRLDAECLLAFALGCDRLRLYTEFDKPVEEAERGRFRELVRRRAEERVPVAQLVGRREFWSLPLTVTGDVLSPRPETETLVAAALDLAADTARDWRILELGTGSGAVALALARERPVARVTATDVSAAALAVARKNAEALGLAERVRLVEGSLFEPVAGERFDLVVSNPPYLAEGQPDLAPELAHEPRIALFAGPRGDEVLRAIAQQVGAALAPNGAVALELDPSQAGDLEAALEAAGLGEIRVHPDLARRPRVISARRGEDA